MFLIIFCHPNGEATTHSGRILRTITEILRKKQKQYEVVDLYTSGFNPLLSKEEYERIRARERFVEEDVKAMQNKISSATTLIFIYPVWWYGTPALLKGFLDRVFTSGFAYRFFKPHPLLVAAGCLLSFFPFLRPLMWSHMAEGKLRGKKALIFRTYGGPKVGKRIYGNMPSVLENSLLRLSGISPISVHELFNVDKKEAKNRAAEEKYFKNMENLLD